ncbi:MAG: AMP-binding protein [Novosphingobium sp.]|nr:AMP-binding protein [Novosphingobium sp.]
MTDETACTINATFEAAVAEAPEHLYLEFSGDAYSYARMDGEVERFARGLHALGVAPGDRVVGLLDNGPDAVICWYATNRIGAVYVPINTAYKGEYLRHQVSDSGARIMICDSEFLGDVLAVVPDLPELEQILHTGQAGDAAAGKVSVSPIDQHRLDAGELPEVDVAPSDLAMLIYTSGTTGLSKGCMVSHNYMCDVARRYCATIGRLPEDRVWLPMPLFHITGISMAILTMQLRSSAAFARKFSLSKLWPEIERTEATFVVLLGTMALMVANAPDTEESRRCKGQLRTLIGIPMNDHIAGIWKERFGLTWCSGTIYGSTEAGQALNARYDERLPDGSCGKINDTFDVRIVDADDQELPTGEIGEIVLRPKKPDVMFAGYWNNPEATIQSWRNLWHHMGDNGRVDEAGNFFFVDRSKDVIRRRGENISSFEMETIFNQHPDIAEAAIHAVASEFMEDDVKATLVLQPDAQLTGPELLEWATSRVPRFALPRYVEFREELPKNASGRVLKFRLREDAVTAATWDRDQA